MLLTSGVYESSFWTSNEVCETSHNQPTTRVTARAPVDITLRFLLTVAELVRERQREAQLSQRNQASFPTVISSMRAYSVSVHVLGAEAVISSAISVPRYHVAQRFAIYDFLRAQWP